MKLDEVTISTRELRANLTEYIMQAAFGEKAVIITHHGKPKAVLVPVEALALLRNETEPEIGLQQRGGAGLSFSDGTK